MSESGQESAKNMHEGKHHWCGWCKEMKKVILVQWPPKPAKAEKKLNGCIKCKYPMPDLNPKSNGHA